MILPKEALVSITTIDSLAQHVTVTYSATSRPYREPQGRRLKNTTTRTRAASNIDREQIPIYSLL